MPKLVSLNMCADPYLLGFAAPEQILALTPQSHDPQLSPFARAAAGFAVSNGRVEDILRAAPDLVIASPYAQALKHRQLRASGVRVFTLAATGSYAQARREIIALGRAIGRAAAAADYLARLDAELDAARMAVAANAPMILPIQRRGFTIGRAHILADIIRLSGARLAHDFGGETRAMRLEAMLTSRANFLLAPRVRASDRGTELLAHPALKARFAPSQWLYIADNLTLCAGAATPRAVKALRRALADAL